MTANWSFTPVCGLDFWRVIVTSPEVLIFLFFMITDPKTTPSGAVGRVAFGFLVAIASTLLLAPQTDEFGTKVGLLAGLVVICAARPILDRIVPEPRTAADDIGGFARRLAIGGAGRGALRGVARAGVLAVALVAVGVGIVAAGTPARGVVVADTAEFLGEIPRPVDPSTLPAITVGPDVVDFDHQLAGPEMQQVVVTLAQNLQIENQALLAGDENLLTAVDHGDRLLEMQGRLRAAQAGEPLVLTTYDFDTLDVGLLRPFGKQTGLSLGFKGRGVATDTTYDASGAVVGSSQRPFEQTFAMRRATGARWLDVAVLP